MILALYLGAASVVLALIAALFRPSDKSVVLVALSFFFASLCFLFILWSNTRVDISSILDTVNGWYFGGVALMVASSSLSAISLIRYFRSRRDT